MQFPRFTTLVSSLNASRANRSRKIKAGLGVINLKQRPAEKRPAEPNLHFEPIPWPDDEDIVGWEEWYYQSAELAFRSESEAYRLLASLQGVSIPRCFGIGTLILEEPAPSFLTCFS